MAVVCDDNAQPALELDAQLAVGAVGDLDFDEGHVGDAPRLGYGFLGHPASVEPARPENQNSARCAFTPLTLYWHQQGIETLLPSGKRNPAAGIMFALLAEMARAERETLSERIKSGLKEARRKGRKLGRPQGTSMDDKELLIKHSDIVRRLREGHSIRNTAKITGKGGSTVQRVKAVMVVA